MRKEEQQEYVPPATGTDAGWKMPEGLFAKSSQQVSTPPAEYSTEATLVVCSKYTCGGSRNLWLLQRERPDDASRRHDTTCRGQSSGAVHRFPRSVCVPHSASRLPTGRDTS